MSTANKLTYLNETKQELKDKINNLGGDITDETTFRQYAEQLQNVYDNAPKTSYAEGSNITLSNTLKGKLDFEDGIVGYGDIKQDIYSGKNLWGGASYINGTLFKTNSNGTIDVTLNNQEGTSAVTTQAVQNGIVKTLKAGTYTFSATGLDNGYLAAHIVKVNSSTSGEVIQNLTNVTTAKTFTLTEDIEYFIRVQAVQPITYTGTVYLQVESGNTATEWEKYVGGIPSPSPSYPQDIEVVRGTQTVYIKDENNNIIDTKTINLGEYEFAKIGNYVDTIEYDVDEDKVYKNEKIGKNDFDENLSYEDFSAYWGQGSFGTRLTNIGTDKIVWSDMLCKYFVAYTSSEIKNLNNEMVVGTSSMIFNNPNISTLTEWIIWVTTHHFSVFYPKSTSTLIEITDTTLKTQVKALYNAHSNNGTTIIEINGQLPLIIKVRALKGE